MLFFHPVRKIEILTKAREVHINHSSLINLKESVSLSVK